MRVNVVPISPRKTCSEKVPAELTSVRSDLAPLYSGTKFFHPLVDHSRTVLRWEVGLWTTGGFRGQPVGQGTTREDFGLVWAEDGGLRNREAVAQFGQFRLT